MANYKEIFDRQRANEEKVKKLCQRASHQSGIYCFYRVSEQGIKHAYVGLARKSLLTRLAQHLEGYNSHIDLSIRKYGLYDFDTNPYGYKIEIVCFCKPNECEEKEQYWIKEFANKGWQLKNTESGGLKGKFDINERKSGKTYTQGVLYGEKKAIKQISELFDKYLDCVIKEPSNKIKERKLKEFEDLLKGEQ